MNLFEFFLLRCSMPACVSGAVRTIAALLAPLHRIRASTRSTRRACSRLPAAVMIMLFGAYHEEKHPRTASPENCETVSGVPRIGSPSG